jgi:hypothetical protein
MLSEPIHNTSHNKWFKKRRRMFLKNMLKTFFRTYTRFQEVYEHYTVNLSLSFKELDQLVGTETRKGKLWQLKDSCHALWRDAGPASEMNGCLLDWVLGSIFHEAMKLKENIYMLEYYGLMAESMYQQNTPSTVRLCGVECQRFMGRTQSEIRRQVENLGFMFGRANYLMRIIMNEQNDNLLLIRFLVENPEIPRELWSEELDELFTDIFPNGPEWGYCAAARSYKEGDWFAKALDAYQKALVLNPACDEAQRHVYQLKGLVRSHDQLLNTTQPA